MDFLDSSEHEVADDGGGNRDANLCDGHKHAANCIDEGKLRGILKNKNESVDCRRAEVFIRDSHINVGILIEESDKSVKAVKTASYASK